MKLTYAALMFLASQACLADELNTTASETPAMVQDKAQEGGVRETTLDELIEPSARDDVKDSGKVPVPLKVVTAVTRTVSYLGAINPIYWMYRGLDAVAEEAGIRGRLINKEADMIQNPKPLWDAEE